MTFPPYWLKNTQTSEKIVKLSRLAKGAPPGAFCPLAMKTKTATAILTSFLAIALGAQAQNYVYAPTNTFGAGVQRIVPDVLLWYSANGYYTNGPIHNLTDQEADLGNWEPYIDQMGGSVFLVAANTFADDGTFQNQRYAVTFQPVAGGRPVNGDEFYADNGTPFRQEIDLSRENGNPQRIAGDHRPGATNFLSMAETSAGQLTNFASNTRWNANAALFSGQNRYCTEQSFSLDPATLAQKPLFDAWDFVYGPTAATTLPTVGGNNAPQLSRTGGKPVGLDNGNFALVIDDKTGFSSTAGEVTTFSIVTPAGAVVAGPTLVNPSAIWDNVAAFKGGFAVRVGSYLAFYDNTGKLTATNANVNTSSGLTFDAGRGDGTRIGSDIGSHYVYLAGATPASANSPVSLAIFDARTGQCVATNTVSDTDPTVHSIDRVVVAVDANDHFCVVYDMNPDATVWSGNQIVARVGKFDGTNISFITPSFFPFVNSDQTTNNILGYVTITPSVAMTTNYICIAGKGTVNSTNNPAGGPDTAPQTTLYTVLSNPKGYIPVPYTAAAAGITNVVPDVLLWYSANGYYTNGPIHNLGEQEADLGNWEPYIDQMGGSVFLVAANTFADDGTFQNQRYAVTFQPAAGGRAVNGDEFYADNGSPFRQEIDLSRENGNPLRIAGDHRPGATNFLSMAETSAGQLTNFASNTRWNANAALFSGQNRYCTEQGFSLDPSTLTQKPLFDAWDFVYGPTAATTLPTAGANNAPQLSRTGGKPVGLDNGNFALVIDDKTGFSSSSGEVTTFSIVTPAGAVVAGPTLVNPSAIWDNVAAFKGGFAVRVGSYLAFYDNTGKPTFTNSNINASSGLSFDAGRGDGARIGSDIGSHYVYMAGTTPSAGNAPVSLAIFDSRTGAFVTSTTVTDTDPSVHSIDRVTVAVDANDHFCVVYDMNPNPTIWSADQIVARVGQFDGTNITFLTPSFFPLVNSESNPTNVVGLLTENPSVAMTTNYICIAGKGTVNSTNNPAGGPDTATQTTLYTVINNPSGTVAPGAQGSVLTITPGPTGSVTVSWTGTGTLQSTTAFAGAQTVWTPVGTSSPALVKMSSADMFFRVVSQ